MTLVYPSSPVVLGVRDPALPGDAPAVVDGAAVEVFLDADCTVPVSRLALVGGGPVTALDVTGLRVPYWTAAEADGRVLYQRGAGVEGPGTPVYPVGVPAPAEVTLPDDLVDAADLEAAITAAVAGLVATSDARLSDARAPLSHTHPTSQVVGLDAALAARASTASVTDAIATAVAGLVTTSDSRLSDARTPLAHVHPTSQVTGLDTALAAKVGTGDSRLTDARTPLAHAASHGSGGTDAVTPAAIGAATAAALTAGLAGKVDTGRLVSAGTGLTGGGSLAADRTLAVAYGSAAGTAAQGNDSRLSDARAPLAHAASHAAGGSDPVTPAAIGALPGQPTPALSRWWAGSVGQAATTTLVQSVMYLFPLWLPALTLQKVAVEVTTAAASSFARVGFYGADAGGYVDLASGPLADLGQVDASTTGIKQLAASLTLPAPRLVWAAVTGQGGTIGLRSGVGTYVPWMPLGPSDTPLSPNVAAMLALIGVTGAMPSSGVPVQSNLNVFKLWFQRSAS